MSEGLLTLQEAAAQVGCHYMTLYRKVRSGEVEALVAGGRYRIHPEALQRWLEARPARRGAHRPADDDRDWAEHARHLEDSLVRGDESACRHAVERLVANGADPVDLCERALVPSLVRIGERWAAGSLNVAEEHRASTIVLGLLGAIAPAFSRPGPRRGVAIVATPAGNAHGLPAAMVAAALRADRFTVHNVGPDVPASDLARLAVSAGAQVGALSVAIADPGYPQAREAVAALHGVGVPVMVGGRGIDAAGAREVGADRFGSDLREAQRLARELVAA